MSNERTKAAAEGVMSASTVAALEARKALGVESGDMESAAEMLRDEVVATRARLELDRAETAKQIGVDGRALKIFETRGNAKPKHLKRYSAWVIANRAVDDDSVD